MKSMLIRTDDSIEMFKRITHAAKPYFARFAQKPTLSLHKTYPKTIRLLFELALKVEDGKYGEENKREIPILMEGMTYPISTVIELLRTESKRKDVNERPEIFDSDMSLISMKEEDLNGLLRIFHEYIANLVTPSHLTVEILLEHGHVERALDQALQLSSDQEKGRGIGEVIDWKLDRNQLEEAVSIFGKMPSDFDMRAVGTKIINKMLERRKVDRAFEFGMSLAASDERDHAMQVIALWLADNNQLGKGLALVDDCLEGNYREYVLSLMVNVIVGRNMLDEAKKLAFSIGDRGYRSDALNAIVKKMMRLRRIPEAIAFVENLSDVLERQESEKIITSALVALQQDQRIKALRKRMGPIVE